MSQTIRQYITRVAISQGEKRLEKLKSLRAPFVLVEAVEREQARWKEGTVKINGEQTLLDVEFESVETRTGNGGKKYLQFNGSINFFPEARHGLFIAKKVK
jgi:hypothetical protein